MHLFGWWCGCILLLSRATGQYNKVDFHWGGTGLLHGSLTLWLFLRIQVITSAGQMGSVMRLKQFLEVSSDLGSVVLAQRMQTSSSGSDIWNARMLDSFCYVGCSFRVVWLNLSLIIGLCLMSNMDDPPVCLVLQGSLRSRQISPPKGFLTPEFWRYWANMGVLI